MNIVHEFLKSTVPVLHFPYQTGNNNDKSVIETLTIALEYAFYSFVKNNDAPALQCFNEDNIRTGLSDFLKELCSGFGTAYSGVDRIPDICNAVVNRLCLEICRPQLTQTYDKVDVNGSVDVDSHFASIMRNNFTMLSDSIRINLCHYLRIHNYGGLSGLLERGRLHPIYGDRNVVKPTAKELAILFASDGKSALEVGKTSKNKEFFTHFDNIPDTIKNNPFLAAVCLVNHRKINPHETNYYEFNRQRHSDKAHNFLSNALEISAYKHLRFLGRFPTTNEKERKIYSRLADVALNTEALETLLTANQVDLLSMVRAQKTEPLGRVNNLLKFLNASNTDDIDAHLSNAVCDAYMVMEAYNHLERSSQHALNSELSDDDDIELYLWDIYELFKQFPIMKAACIAQPFESTQQFIYKNFSRHQGLCSKILANAPLSLASALVTSQDMQLNTLKMIFDFCTDQQVNDYELMINDYKTNQLAHLLADMELTHPGFIKDSGIDVDDTFAFQTCIDEVGLGVYYQKINATKIEAMSNIKTANEDVGFLTPTGAL